MQELVYEVQLHEQASSFLTCSAARVAQEVSAAASPVNSAVRAENCHWDEPHRRRLDRLHLARVEVAELMGKSTRVASLCIEGIKELVEMYRSDNCVTIELQLARACGVLENLVGVGAQLLAIRRQVLGALDAGERGCAVRSVLTDHQPISAAAMQEAQGLLDRLRLKH